MSTWESISWIDFANISKDKTLVLWGAGKRCTEKLPYLKKNNPDLLIVDKNKVGQTIGGVTVQSPGILSCIEKAVVLICGKFAYEIKAELNKINPQLPCYSEYWIDNREFLDKRLRYQPDIDMERVSSVMGLLQDEESRRIFARIVEKRKTGEADYSDILSNTGYFPCDIFAMTNNEVFVDCGAYNGDTISEFIDTVDDFERIISYEADPYNYESITKSMIYGLNTDKIDVYNLAVSDHEKELVFNCGIGPSSFARDLDDTSFAPDDQTASIKVRAVQLDNHLASIKPTMIKMDIEGAEMDALHGAEIIIKEFKPKLAICLYHRMDDILDIPEFIHELVPEYKLYIRHQSAMYFDTVLYATV